MRHGRRDTTHGPIREALRDAGYLVEDTGDVGHDFPDLIVRSRRGPVFIEAKSPGGHLSDGQREFGARWGRWYVVAFSPEEALEAVRAVERGIVAGGGPASPTDRGG